MIAVPTSLHHPKVLLIGSSGMVGMATSDAITQYLGADVLSLDVLTKEAHNETEIDAREKETHARREQRVQDYQSFVAQKDNLLDGKHANWLLRDHKKLTEDEYGHFTSIDISREKTQKAALIRGIKEGLEKGADCIVITAGVGRKSDQETRGQLIQNNVPFFENLGMAIASFVVAKIKEHPDYHLPPLINVGNPMDTMLEITGRTVCEGIEKEAKRILGESQNINHSDIYRENARQLTHNLSRELKNLRGKFIGQGGVLDGARAAFAINKLAGIPFEDIKNVPVLGTHNPLMTIDFNETRITHNGMEKPLGEVVNLCRMVKNPKEGQPDITLEARISAETSAGGGAVINDYAAKTGKKQSAILSTGAASMLMVEPIITHKAKNLPAAIYNIPEHLLAENTAPEAGNAFVQKTKKGDARKFSDAFIHNGVVMGRMVTLGENGVTHIFPPDPALKKALATAAADEVIAMQSTRFGR